MIIWFKCSSSIYTINYPYGGKYFYVNSLYCFGYIPGIYSTIWITQTTIKYVGITGGSDSYKTSGTSSIDFGFSKYDLYVTQDKYLVKREPDNKVILIHNTCKYFKRGYVSLIYTSTYSHCLIPPYVKPLSILGEYILEKERALVKVIETTPPII